MISQQLNPSGPVAAVAFDTDRAIDDGASVLIVDDDHDHREQLTDYLVGHGLRAEPVESGAALRQRLGVRSCDLIVLDMMMPGEDGFSLLHALARADDGPGL